jgi:signal transduction histidine kinase
VTIKSRLIISAVIMLFILVLVGLALGQGAKFLLFDVRETRVGFYFNDPSFFETMMKKVAQMTELRGGENDPTQWLAEVEKFNNDFGSANLSLLIYKDGLRLIGREIEVDPQLLALALSSPTGDLLMSLNQTTIYTSTSDPYKILLIDTDFFPSKVLFENSNTVFYHLLVGWTVIFMMTVLLGGLFLIRFVFRPVTYSLETLAEGVHHIRDGKLDCRIVYEPKDEFAKICDDFNVMAQRLEDAEAKQQQDQESRQELIAGISHDLRTPLTSIKACAEGLVKGVPASPEKCLKYLNGIKVKVEDIEKIINRLLVFSRLNIQTFPARIERLDLVETVKELLREAGEEYAGNGLILDFKAYPAPVRVNLDRILFRNALINIFENSQKYKQSDRGKVDIGFEVDEGKVRLILADDGPGVPDESLNKIFEVFYRCDPARGGLVGGSGLGLAITSRIIDQLGGVIRAENGSEGGLRLVMIFPLARGEDD